MAQRKENNFSKSKGFTLIEIVIGMVILGGIISLIILLFFDLSDFSSIFSTNLGTEQEINNTLNDMILEMRPMGYSSVGSYPIDSASTSSVAFYSDVDGDKLFERIRYYLSGNILKKGFLKPAGNPLVYNNVNEIISDSAHAIVNSSSTPMFSYYNSAGNLMSPPFNISDIRRIKVIISAKQPSQRTPLTYTIDVTPRNLRR